ncbi:MAG TPA: hypothetical protein VI233_17125, partial [Puia sp.]
MRNALLFCCLVLALSCKKNKPEQGGTASTPLITAVGSPKGTSVSKQIGASGGSLTSTDNGITIEIPAGALSSDQTITIQPIS